MFLSTQFVIMLTVCSLTMLGLVSLCAILCAKSDKSVKTGQDVQQNVVQSGWIDHAITQYSMSDKEYNDWRRDIAAEYFLRTGRAYPRANTPHGRVLREMLVYMSDHDPKSVMDTVDLLLEIEVLPR